MTDRPVPPPPLLPVNFKVAFHQVDAAGADTAEVALCGGYFSEVSGLEATMEPKAIREGGRNYGEAQRVGRVTFATVILKRGMTTAPDLWTWFDLVAKQGKSAVRLRAEVIHLGPDRVERLRWTLRNALPIKFKAAAYVASSSDVGVEELHIVHDELGLVMAGAAA